MRTLKLKIQETQQTSSSITKSYQNQTAQAWSKENILNNAGGGVGWETTYMERLKGKMTDLFLKTIQAKDNGAIS